MSTFQNKLRLSFILNLQFPSIYSFVHVPDAVMRIVFAVSVASKPLPGQPAHRRCPGQPILQSQRPRGQCGEQNQGELECGQF